MKNRTGLKVGAQGILARSAGRVMLVFIDVLMHLLYGIARYLPFLLNTMNYFVLLHLVGQNESINQNKIIMSELS